METIEEIHRRENFAMLQSAIERMNPNITRFDELESFILSSTQPDGKLLDWDNWNIFSQTCNDKLKQMRIEESRCIDCGSPNTFSFCKGVGLCGTVCKDCGSFIPGESG